MLISIHQIVGTTLMDMSRHGSDKCVQSSLLSSVEGTELETTLTLWTPSGQLDHTVC